MKRLLKRLKLQKDLEKLILSTENKDDKFKDKAINKNEAYNSRV